VAFSSFASLPCRRFVTFVFRMLRAEYFDLVLPPRLVLVISGHFFAGDVGRVFEKVL